MLSNLAFSLVALLKIAVLQQDLLERDVEGPGKGRGRKDPEDIRPIHGWQRRGGGCMDILCQTDGGAQSRRHTVFLQLCLNSQDGACRV